MLGDRGLQCIGKESPIVPMVVGSEQLLRVMARAMLHRKLHANAIEYPAVSLGTARFRFQVMASHTNEHARIAAEVTRDVFEEASALLSVSEQAGQARPAVS